MTPTSLHVKSHCSTTLARSWSPCQCHFRGQLHQERHILIPRWTSSWFTAVLVLGGQAPSSHSTPWWRGSRQGKASIFMSLSRSRECWLFRQWLVMGYKWGHNHSIMYNHCRYNYVFSVLELFFHCSCDVFEFMCMCECVDVSAWWWLIKTWVHDLSTSHAIMSPWI